MTMQPKTLFVIGNGFDIAHGLPTKYSDFRDYLMQKYAVDEDKFYDIPVLHDGFDGPEYDEEELAGFICQVIDNCTGGNWGALENYLGPALIDELMSGVQIDLDASDSDFEYSVKAYQCEAENVSPAFSYLRDFFIMWLRENLSQIDYSALGKPEFKEVLSSGDAFLNFNYTKTLEMAYDLQNVCHIHGIIDDPENALFGHNDEREYDEDIGAKERITVSSSLDDMLCGFIKDTDQAYFQHKDFFDSLSSVTDIYSFGITMVGVDRSYAAKIAEKAPGATWHLNKRAMKNQKLISFLESLGFKVVPEERW